MKHGKIPTRNQKEIMMKNDIDPRGWLVIKNLSDRFEIVNRENNKEKKELYY